jgi:hypothetical protein
MGSSLKKGPIVGTLNRDAAGAGFARQFTLPSVSMAAKWGRKAGKSNDFAEAR